MSHTLISTLIDAFETKLRSERALWEYRLQTEISSLRQALLSVVPQSINSSSTDVLQVQEEQQMLRDMIVDLQDSFESLNRRFISSKVSLPSEDDDTSDDEDDSSIKNDIIYPPIYVEKVGAARPAEPDVVKIEEDVKAVIVTPEPSKKLVTDDSGASNSKSATVSRTVTVTPTPMPASSSVVEEDEEDEDEDEEEEALELEEFTFKGRTLYKDADGNIYDEAGENVIGRKTEKGVAFFRK